MAAMAARSMGYDVVVLDPDPDCSARPVASRTFTAKWSDAAAAAELARLSDVVTLEIEQIPRATLDAVTAHAPLHPRAEAVYIVQDRARQKEWLVREGFPLGAVRTVHTAAECTAAIAALGPSIVKSAHGGYDGRGQVRVKSAAEGEAAWHGVGGGTAVVEQFLALREELSVLVARSATGEIAVYPPSRNHHTNGVLTWAVVPGGFGDRLVAESMALARAIAERLGIVGLLAIEMFVLDDGTLLVNELAPRPHNTYHHSERANATSQFEQLVRAVCGLPLGDTALVAPGAIHNVLGDLWTDGAPDFAAAMRVRGVRVHLYGKRESRPGRKMGHLSSVGATADEALARVRD
ncbi:MAG: 5-(carboxyamino)imidazole ribonucleotide synthase, partial [Gemmatimonadetes bacterium]|nr:5-(carboxyamino)imidazole ribonucleotide synthase [Gemmatimonadota bacterium]